MFGPRRFPINEPTHYARWGPRWIAGVGGFWHRHSPDLDIYRYPPRSLTVRPWNVTFPNRKGSSPYHHFSGAMFIFWGVSPKHPQLFCFVDVTPCTLNLTQQQKQQACKVRGSFVSRSATSELMWQSDTNQTPNEKSLLRWFGNIDRGSTNIWVSSVLCEEAQTPSSPNSFVGWLDLVLADEISDSWVGFCIASHGLWTWKLQCLGTKKRCFFWFWWCVPPYHELMQTTWVPQPGTNNVIQWGWFTCM